MISVSLGLAASSVRTKAAPEVPPYDIYVNNVTGSDAADGASPSTALATLSAARTAAFARGDGARIALARGSHWREDLVLTGLTGCTIHGVGPDDLPLPRIDGRDLASPAGWSKTGGRTHVYQRSWSHAVAATPGKTKINVWEDGRWLTWVASVAACDATPGSFHVADTAAVANPALVYIHPAGSVDPATSGRLYEITARSHCLLPGEGEDVRRVWTIGQGHHDGSIVCSATGYHEDCLASHGIVHNYFVVPGGRLKGCVAFQCQPMWRSGTAATLFVTHTSQPAAGVTRFENCFAFHDASMEHNGFYGHTSGGTSVRLPEIRVIGGGVFAPRAASAASTDRLTIRDLWVENAGRTNDAQQLWCVNGLLDVDNAVLLNPGRGLLGIEVVARDVRVALFSPISGGLIASEKSDIQRCTFYASLSAPSPAGGHGTLGTLSKRLHFSSNYANTQSVFRHNAVVGFGNWSLVKGAASGYDSDFNAFHTDSRFIQAGSEMATLAEWQAATGLDANSVETGIEAFEFGSPRHWLTAATDPRNNDWSFGAGSVVATGGRSAGSRKHLDRPDWASLKARWSAGYIR